MGASRDGLYGKVLALIVHDDKLVAGGYFTVAGGVSPCNIAAWTFQ